MSTLSSHVLDTARGRPAAGLRVTLSARAPDGTWRERGAGATDGDGRVKSYGAEPLAAGVYRLVFETGAWHRAQGVEGFYPEVQVVFEVRAPGEHYHVPLLLSPFGYSTYRGS